MSGYSDKTSLWVDTIENPTNYETYLIGIITREIPSVTLTVGGSKAYPIVWLKGPEHAVKWFRYLLALETWRTNHVYDTEMIAGGW